MGKKGGRRYQPRARNAQALLSMYGIVRGRLSARPAIFEYSDKSLSFTPEIGPGRAGRFSKSRRPVTAPQR
jgi:hypothetical protein